MKDEKLPISSQLKKILTVTKQYLEGHQTQELLVFILHTLHFILFDKVFGRSRYFSEE